MIEVITLLIIAFVMMKRPVNNKGRVGKMVWMCVNIESLLHRGDTQV